MVSFRTRFIGLVLACCLSDMALASSTLQLQSLIQAEADRTGIPAAMIEAVIGVESDRNGKAVSPKGAQGLMQLMPDTASRFGVTDPFDPAQNVRGGTTYLAWLYNRYQSWPLALAGYNAGEGAVDKHGGIPPYRETQDYVRKVMARYDPNASGSHTANVFYAVVKPAPAARPQPAAGSLEAAYASPIFFEVGKGI